jgi:hypothetical protein
MMNRLLLSALLAASTTIHAAEPGLVGYWKLRGDSQDHSGRGHHAVNHGVDLASASFDGRRSYLEVADAPALHFGKNDFSVTAEIYTEKGVDDVVGDIVSKFSPAQRQGLNFTIVSNTSGYNSQSDLRQLFFGVDQGATGQWIDCGRPGGLTHCSDALTVFDGNLYVGIVDAPEEKDWAHVFRYRGGQSWEDCGRVGDGQTRGVYAMIVHDGALYAATAGSHGGGKANKGDFGRVYRYGGGTTWEDLGQPGEYFRINSLASYRGKLYAFAIYTSGVKGGVFVHEGGKSWKQCGDFGRPHTSGVHDGRLYAAYPQGKVFAYDGAKWDDLGNPYGTLDQCNQLHSHGVYQGELHVGTWPLGKVAVWRDEKWANTGRLGDATEVVGLVVYNGSFYGGTIPRAEVFRRDGPEHWTSVGRLFDPPQFDLVKDVEDWSRASSLRVFQGKLFSSTATCYRAMLSAPKPNEIRGKVFSYKAGAGVSFDRDLGAGWKHVAAVREKNGLTLYVDGKAVARSDAGSEFDVTNDSPLRIGYGQQSYFRGKIREVRLYNRAINVSDVSKLSTPRGN